MPPVCYYAFCLSLNASGMLLCLLFKFKCLRYATMLRVSYYAYGMLPELDKDPKLGLDPELGQDPDPGQ